MSDRIKLEVVTPERHVFSGEVESLTASTVDGPVEILYNHAPLMTALQLGILKYVRAGKKETIAVGPGFMEVKDNQVMVLARFADLSQDIEKLRVMVEKETYNKSSDQEE
ncbi:MAG: ATP synthase F1 subunit epsilon [Bacillota bacterium]|jgi:F-type H+-transporting ATPase subunit epsilon